MAFSLNFLHPPASKTPYRLYFSCISTSHNSWPCIANNTCKLKETPACSRLRGRLSSLVLFRDKLIYSWEKKKKKKRKKEILFSEKHHMHQQVWFLDSGFEKKVVTTSSLQISKYWWSTFHSFSQKKWTKCCGVLPSKGDLSRTTNCLLSGYCWSALDDLKRKSRILLQPFWVTRSLQNEVKNKFY